ncbi:hypothetical protein EV363DRAFT_1419465 [Boletus edulis]|nr:hypothetical protein EV363DRAFT_1419465 [Boletus edulis]
MALDVNGVHLGEQELVPGQQPNLVLFPYRVWVFKVPRVEKIGCRTRRGRGLACAVQMWGERWEVYLDGARLGERTHPLQPKQVPINTSSIACPCRILQVTKAGCDRARKVSASIFTPSFFGGNSIVGAQVPVSASLAFAQKYLGHKTATFAMYGDPQPYTPGSANYHCLLSGGKLSSDGLTSGRRSHGGGTHNPRTVDCPDRTGEPSKCIIGALSLCCSTGEDAPSRRYNVGSGIFHYCSSRYSGLAPSPDKAVMILLMIDPKFICHWRNLQILNCMQMPLDMTTLVDLSRLPALIDLSFMLPSTLPDQISPSDSPLIFSNFKQLFLDSEFLGLVSHLLSQIRLPALTTLTAYIDFRPARQDDLSLFFSNVRTSGSPRTIQAPRLIQPYETSVPGDRPVLGLEDLQLYVPFSNLRHIQLDIEWKVDLTDSELLTLVSTWPCLEELSINTEWGWNTPGGITPNGLLQLLQLCPLLTTIALAIDTRADISPSPTSLGFLPRLDQIDFVDSFIEEESVPAIAAFIASLVAPCKLDFRAWESFGMKAPYRDMWRDRSGTPPDSAPASLMSDLRDRRAHGGIIPRSPESWTYYYRARRNRAAARNIMMAVVE